MAKPVILCVDDEKIILDSLEEQILQRLGDQYDCELSESATEALELIEDLRDSGRNLAVIVSDQLMPGMKGDEFLIRVHADYPETLKILLTGQASLDSVRNAINKARLYRYITKPWDENDLMLTIEEAARSYQQYLQLLEHNRLLRSLNKASQEISGEINMQRLIEKFMQNTLDNIGAEKGYLVLNKEGSFNVEAVACVIQDEARRLQLKLVNEKPDLTREVLEKIEPLLDHQPEQKDFRLATQISKQGKTIGYVYLENSLTRDVFTRNQIEILQMLASQAAISMENANLYTSLQERSRELQIAKEKVEHINHEIEQKNKDITDSIRYAKRIQEAIMPDRTLFIERFPDSFVLYKPKDIVSGDFYWWAAKDAKFMFAAVDCTGHGVPGAFMSVIGSNFLNQIIKDYSVFEPEVVLQYLNIRVRSTLNQNAQQGGSNDGMDLAFCALDTQTHTLHYAGANRPLFMIRNGELIEYAPTKAPIGGSLIESGEPAFSQQNISLHEDDCIYIFTDGYTDQFGGELGRKFSPRRLKELLVEVHQLPMSQQAERLNQTIEAWRGEIEQTDDILLIGLRYKVQ